MTRIRSTQHPKWIEHHLGPGLGYYLLPEMALDYEYMGEGKPEVGDIIPGGMDFCVEVLETDSSGLVSAVHIRFLDGLEYAGKPALRYAHANHRWSPQRIVEVAATRVDDSYNGNCGRCGRRTYTSALTVEHQGGSCL